MSESDLQMYTHEFFPKRGGISTYCHEFATATVGRKLSCTVHAPENASLPSGTQIAYCLTRGNWKGNHNPPAIWQCRQHLTKQLRLSTAGRFLLAEPASILAYGSLPAKVRESSKVYLTLHGSEIARWQKNTIAARFATRAFDSAAGIAGVSKAIANLASKAFPTAAHKIKAVPNALPHALRKIQADTQLRQLSAESMRVLSVGRIHPRKGFEQVISAIAGLPQALRTSIHYTIIGGAKDTHYLQELRQQAAQTSVNLTIQLDASDTDLEAAYAQADVFALTSMPYKSSVEGFGLVYLEAGAYGLPCIAHDIGGVSDAVINGQTGALLAPGDTAALTETLKIWLLDPEHRQKLGAQNHAFAMSRSWEDVVKETLNDA